MTALELKDVLRFEAACIQRYRERIEQLRGRTGSAPDSGAGPVQGGATRDGVSDAACEIMRLEGQMQARVDAVWEYLVYCDTQAQRDVLKLRYIHWMRWEKIALSMRYSEQHVYRLHWQAMRVICKKLST